MNRCVIAGIAVGCLLSVVSPAAAGWVGAVLPSAMPSAERSRVLQLAETADVATRVDAEPFIAKPEVFEYLLDHPEFATHVTQTLRLARYRVWPTAQGFFLDDGWGARGHFWVVHAGRGTRVMVARGEFRQLLLPAIGGEAVTMIEYGFTPAAEGRSVIRTTVTGFVRLNSRMAALVLKVGGSAAQQKADLEASRLMKVFARASRLIDETPAGVLEQLAQRPQIPRRELQEFGRLLNVR